MTTLGRLAVASLLLLEGRGAAAQVFHAGVEMVLVTVSVTDGQGRLIGGLTRDDFVVLEDGQPQAIAAFTADRLRVRIPDEPHVVRARRGYVSTRRAR